VTNLACELRPSGKPFEERDRGGPAILIPRHNDYENPLQSRRILLLSLFLSLRCINSRVESSIQLTTGISSQPKPSDSPLS